MTYRIFALALLAPLMTMGGGKDIYGNDLTRTNLLGYVDGGLTTVGDVADFASTGTSTNTVQSLIDAAFQGGTQKVNRVTASFDGVSNKVAEIDAELPGISNRVDSLEMATNDLMSLVSGLTSRTNDWNAKQDALMFAVTTNDIFGVQVVTTNYTINVNYATDAGRATNAGRAEVADSADSLMDEVNTMYATGEWIVITNETTGASKTNNLCTVEAAQQMTNGLAKASWVSGNFYEIKEGVEVGEGVVIASDYLQSKDATGNAMLSPRSISVSDTDLIGGYIDFGVSHSCINYSQRSKYRLELHDTKVKVIDRQPGGKDPTVTYQYDYPVGKSGTIALTSDMPAAQIQSDWTQTNTTSKAYIQNKPQLITTNAVCGIITNAVDAGYLCTVEAAAAMTNDLSSDVRHLKDLNVYVTDWNFSEFKKINDSTYHVVDKTNEEYEYLKYVYRYGNYGSRSLIAGGRVLYMTGRPPLFDIQKVYNADYESLEGTRIYFDGVVKTNDTLVTLNEIKGTSVTNGGAVAAAKAMTNAMEAAGTDRQIVRGEYNSEDGIWNVDVRYAEFAGYVENIQWSNVMGTPASLGGYGITDAYTKTQIDGNAVTNGGATAYADATFLKTDSSQDDQDFHIRWIDGGGSLEIKADYISLEPAEDNHVYIGGHGIHIGYWDSLSATEDEQRLPDYLAGGEWNTDSNPFAKVSQIPSTEGLITATTATNAATAVVGDRLALNYDGADLPDATNGMAKTALKRDLTSVNTAVDTISNTVYNTGAYFEVGQEGLDLIKSNALVFSSEYELTNYATSVSAAIDLYSGQTAHVVVTDPNTNLTINLKFPKSVQKMGDAMLRISAMTNGLLGVLTLDGYDSEKVVHMGCKDDEWKFDVGEHLYSFDKTMVTNGVAEIWVSHAKSAR